MFLGINVFGLNRAGDLVSLGVAAVIVGGLRKLLLLGCSPLDSSTSFGFCCFGTSRYSFLAGGSFLTSYYLCPGIFEKKLSILASFV